MHIATVQTEHKRTFYIINNLKFLLPFFVVGKIQVHLKILENWGKKSVFVKNHFRK